jgi:hypothetical protein
MTDWPLVKSEPTTGVATMANLKSRLNKLEANLSSGDEACSGGPLVLLTYYDGDTLPPIPAGAIRREACGEVHLLLVQLVRVPGRTDNEGER